MVQIVKSIKKERGVNEADISKIQQYFSDAGAGDDNSQCQCYLLSLCISTKATAKC